ncbi:MAG: HugZ family protein [Gammaproteobacteria bacterium]
MDNDSQALLNRLFRQQRWAAFSTLEDGRPFTSYVAFVTAKGSAGFYLHISKLAAHTRNVLNDSRVSLAVSETDDGRADPQTLARVSIQGILTPIPMKDSEYDSAKKAYLERFPESAQCFDFSDFMLFKLEPEKIRFVAGFAKTWSLGRGQLAKVLES